MFFFVTIIPPCFVMVNFIHNFCLIWNFSSRDLFQPPITCVLGLCVPPPTYPNTGSSKKVDGIWNRYNLKSTGRIYTFGILKCSEKFKVLDLP